jgi:hypothetical protein
MHTSGGKADTYSKWKLSKDEEEKLLDRFLTQQIRLNLLLSPPNCSQALTRQFYRQCIWTNLCAITVIAGNMQN